MNDDVSMDDAPTRKPARERTSGSNLPPVGDIELKKASKTFNTYVLRLSMGQIEAIRNSLERDHANPVADELKALFDYYINTVPGPGESEEDVKAREEQTQLDNGADEDDDSPVPMPPGEEWDGEVTTAGEGPEDFDAGEEEDAAPEPSSRPQSKPTSLPFKDEEDEVDERLPEPPSE